MKTADPIMRARISAPPVRYATLDPLNRRAYSQCMADALDIRPLEKAIASLEAGLVRLSIAPTDDLGRDGCIQRFEFVYEFSYKMLKRFLKAVSANSEEIEALNFADLIRTGAERGLLLNGWPRWKEFRAARSITSHTYNEAKASEVLAVIPDFLAEARYLLGRLAAELHA